MWKNMTLFLVLFLFGTACQSDSKTANNQKDNQIASTVISVQLTCEDIGSTDEAPHFAVYAIVSERKTKLLEVSSGCQVIEEAQFADFQIPNDASAAVGGWWAGTGDYFYAQQNGAQIKFFHAVADEAQEKPGYDYQEIASYENGKFDVKQ